MFKVVLKKVLLDLFTIFAYCAIAVNFIHNGTTQELWWYILLTVMISWKINYIIVLLEEVKEGVWISESKRNFLLNKKKR